jgi:ParB/RepB/Spo0J family partition protein
MTEAVKEFNAPKEMRIQRIDPRAIREEKGFNVRLKYEEEEINELKNSIIKQGVKVSLRGKKIAKNDYVLTDGHRRHRAVMKAIKEGHDIKYVPFTLEPKNYSEEHRIADLITMNSGKALNPVEEAEVFQRLKKFGWTQEEIADHIGKTQAHVSGRLKVAEFSKYIKGLLVDKVIKTNLALEITENFPNVEDQKKALTPAIKKMKEAGQKKVVAQNIKPPRKKKETSSNITLGSQERTGKYHKLFDDTIQLMTEKKWQKRKIDKVKAIKKLLDSKDPQAMFRGFSKMAL